MNATTTRANPWSDLPPAQLPAKQLQAFLIIAARAPAPVSWQALALKIWPHVNDAPKRQVPNVSNLISNVRAALGDDAVRGGYVAGWSLGIPERRPVPVQARPPYRKEVSVLPAVAFGEPLEDTAAALLSAQEWAQNQRPSARGVARS